MENEKFQELVLQQLTALTESQQQLNERLVKISALFDGFSLRGDQIENLKKHIDERLDNIQIDTDYLVSKVASFTYSH